jgi:hypothetical protein
MISSNPNKAINLDLVDLICDNIPDWTWTVVKEQLIDAMVDAMPTHILEKLTGDPAGDERALEILDDYYKSDKTNKDLIIDSFKILGEDQTTYLLDALQLEKIQQPTNNND